MGTTENLVCGKFLVQGETEIAITRQPLTIARPDLSIAIEKASPAKRSIYRCIGKIVYSLDF